jgi:hypothetical protein
MYTVLLLPLPCMAEGTVVALNTVLGAAPLLPLLGLYVAGPAGFHPSELMTLPAG